MSSELSEIDQVRWERDTAKAENARLRAEVARLQTLLSAADAAVREEYRLRLSNGTGPLNCDE